MEKVSSFKRTTSINEVINFKPFFILGSMLFKRYNFYHIFTLKKTYYLFDIQNIIEAVSQPLIRLSHTYKLYI